MWGACGDAPISGRRENHSLRRYTQINSRAPTPKTFEVLNVDRSISAGSARNSFQPRGILRNQPSVLSHNKTTNRPNLIVGESSFMVMSCTVAVRGTPRCTEGVGDTIHYTPACGSGLNSELYEGSRGIEGVWFVLTWGCSVNKDV